MNDMFMLKSIMREDNKIVAFVGTSKNGTSFIVNHLALIFASIGINTAVLDMTTNKNSYYLYTHNNDDLRNIAENTMDNLKNGIAEGIKFKKNLTVYTSIPEQSNDISEPEKILTTLVKNHSLILIDCDFTTDTSFFRGSQEIYLVQSMDIITIQPLTKFLYELNKSRNLDVNKIRIILNKKIKTNAFTDEMIVKGMSGYNDPRMRYRGDTLDTSRINVNKISFSEKAYIKYLERLSKCEISTFGYPKKIVKELKQLSKSIYKPLSKKNV